MRVYLDISEWWPVDESGEPRSVNSVHEEIRALPEKVGRNTLRLALEGKLDRGYFSNQIKLARMCSAWSGQDVTPNDLLKVFEDKE